MKNLLFISFFFVSLITSGQNPYFYTIDKTNGLPSNSVYDIFQDSKGFMWFATGKGLCRYDGSVFKTYTSDNQTSKSGSCIKEDGYGRIWYCNFDGYLYYVENGTLKTLAQKESIGYSKYGIINNLLFLMQTKSVAVYDLKTLKLIYSYPIPNENIQATFSSKSRFYFVGNNIYEINYPNPIKSYPLTHDFSKNQTVPIVEVLNDEFFIVSKFSNHYYTFKKNKLFKKEFNKKIDFIQNLAIVDHSPWLCTPNGIIKYEHEKATTYFSDLNISYIFKDKQQNYWIATANSGLLYIQDFKNNFIPLSPKPTLFSKFGNQLVIGTENDHVYKLQLDNLSLKTLYKNNSNHPINQIIGNEDNKHIYFTSSKFKILNQNNTLVSETSVAIKDVKKVDDTYYSFAGSGLCGLFKIGTKKSIWDSIYTKHLTSQVNFNDSRILLLNGKSTAYNPYNKHIYYATNVGLKYLNLNSINEITFKKKPVFITYLQSYQNEIYALSTNEELYKIDAKNTISKLSLLEQNSKQRFTKFRIQQNSLYLFTTNGIIQYDLLTKKHQKTLPLTSDLEVTDLIVLEDKIFFATSKGIIIKDKIASKNFAKPKLIINEIKVNNKLSSLKKLTNLTYHDNDISINFSALSFIPNEKNNVVYQINDTNWKRLDAENKNLILSSLSPGTYKVALKLDTNEITPIKVIHIKINNPFWLNPIFLIVMSIIFSILLYLFYRHQIQKIEAKNKLIFDKINLEKNVNQSKLKAIKSQMNPHFFYNALNTLQSYILSNEKKEAIEYLSKFSNLTRTILEMTEKDQISVAEEIKTLKLYLDIEKGRFEADFRYEITIDPEIDSESLKIPSMLLQPYVENAIKHGLLHKSGEKKLKIVFDKEIENLKISIEDNGIGRQKSNELNKIKNRKHQSFATEALQNRIDLLNEHNHKNITIEIIDNYNLSQQPLGTTVVLKIPFEL